jgi:hypothetical protein
VHVGTVVGHEFDVNPTKEISMSWGSRAAWHSRTAGLVLSLFAAAFVVGCDDDDDDDPMNPDVGTATVRVHFDEVSDGAPLVLGSMQYENGAGNSFSVTKFVYIVTNISFDLGTYSVRYPMAHLRDANDAATRSVTFDDVPVGDYDSVTFTFGMDGADNKDPNQGGTWPVTTAWNDMLWPASWGGGYHYMKFEGMFMNDIATAEGFATHAGRRHAMADGMFGTDATPQHHHYQVTLPTSMFTVAGEDTWDVSIEVDVEKWHGEPGPNMIDLDENAGMIMMNTVIQNRLEANGPTVFSLGSVTKDE